jgi:glutamate dehydrogenase
VELAAHRLRRRIVATSLVNDLVDHLGPGFVHRIEERTGAGTPDAVRAYVITRDVFELRTLWSSLRQPDQRVGPQAELLVLQDTARLLDHCAAWLLRNRRLPLDLAREVTVFRDSVQTLAQSLFGVLDATSRADVEARARVLTDAGVPREAAHAAALLGVLAAGYDLVELAGTLSADPVRVAAVYFAIGHRLDLRGVRARVSGARVDSHWTSIAQAALLDELSAQLRRLTAAALVDAAAGAEAAEVVDRWVRDNDAGLARWDALVQELRRGEAALLAPAVVAVQILRDLAASTAVGQPVTPPG